MGIGTLIQFLFGGRDAILRIASTRSALIVGALFVLSAGLAREYDGEDLLHRPQTLLLPFAASLGTSIAIFGLVWFASRFLADQPTPFLRGYRGFLALYWMTAPLAWLYAIPWERLTDSRSAVDANIWTLIAISIWRVALMTRCVGVLTGGSYMVAMFIILTVSDIAVLVAAYSTPIPLYALMSGMRLPPDEMARINWQTYAGGAAIFGILPLGLMTLSAIAMARKPWSFPAPTFATRPRASMPLWTVAVASVGLWAPILRHTQPEQVNRRIVETALADHRIDVAFDYLRSHEQKEFPPHWRPTPQFDLMTEFSPIYEIASRLRDSNLPAWAYEPYREAWTQTARVPDLLCFIDEQQAGVLEQWVAQDADFRHQLCDRATVFQLFSDPKYCTAPSRRDREKTGPVFARIANLLAESCPP